MIDLYYWQHSDRRLAASMPWWADLVSRYGVTKPSGRKTFVRLGPMCGAARGRLPASR